MCISDFELDIEEKILMRGERYFADGLVVDLWEPSLNCYHGVVAGTIPYDVEIHIDTDGMILHHDCDCPYDWGEYCKHEVAVLFQIRKHLAQGATLKRQGQKQGLHALLHRKSKEELAELLYALVVEHDLREDIFYHIKSTDN